MQGEPPGGTGDGNGNGNGNGRLTRFRLGEFIVDANARTLRHADETVVLAPRTMDVLVYLAQQAGETVTNEALLDTYWRGAISSTNAIHKCVAELRQALGDDRAEPQYIVTVPRRGYRLIADVEPIHTLGLANGNGNGNGNGHTNHDASTASREEPAAVDDTGREDDVAAPAPRSARLIAVAATLALILGAVVWYARAPATVDSPAIAGTADSTTATSAAAATDAPGTAQAKPEPPKPRLAILAVTGTGAKDAALARAPMPSA